MDTQNYVDFVSGEQFLCQFGHILIQKTPTTVFLCFVWQRPPDFFTPNALVFHRVNDGMYANNILRAFERERGPQHHSSFTLLTI